MEGKEGTILYVLYVWMMFNIWLWELATEDMTPCEGCADGFDATRRNG